MTISRRQFAHLTEIGINLWQRKASQTSTEQINDTNETATRLSVDIKTLSNSQLFKDLLTHFNLSIGEVNIQDNKINLGFINWQLTKQTKCQLNQQVLTTPPLSEIMHSPQLKCQLWQLLAEQQ